MTAVPAKNETTSKTYQKNPRKKKDPISIIINSLFPLEFTYAIKQGKAKSTAGGQQITDKEKILNRPKNK